MMVFMNAAMRVKANKKQMIKCIKHKLYKISVVKSVVQHNKNIEIH